MTSVTYLFFESFKVCLKLRSVLPVSVTSVCMRVDLGALGDVVVNICCTWASTACLWNAVWILGPLHTSVALIWHVEIGMCSCGSIYARGWFRPICRHTLCVQYVFLGCGSFYSSVDVVVVIVVAARVDEAFYFSCLKLQFYQTEENMLS